MLIKACELALAIGIYAMCFVLTAQVGQSPFRFWYYNTKDLLPIDWAIGSPSITWAMVVLFIRVALVALLGYNCKVLQNEEFGPVEEEFGYAVRLYALNK